MENSIELGAIFYMVVLGIAFAIVFIFGVYTVFYFFFTNLYLTIIPRPLFPHLYTSIRILNVEYQRILEQKSLFYKRLSPKHKKYFEHRVARFLEKYKFETQGDIQITNEIKVIVASCYTKVNFGYRNFLSVAFDRIIILPDAYYSKITKNNHVGHFNPSRRSVVFSWKHFIYSYENKSDNLNLGIHEFTHVLKHESLNSFDISSGFFTKNLADLQDLVYSTRKIERLKAEDYLRKRAFVDNHEFFAVLVEHYFETPHIMLEKYPQLFKKTTAVLNYNKYLYALES